MRFSVILSSAVLLVCGSIGSAAVIPFNLGSPLNSWSNGQEVPFFGAGGIDDVTSGNVAPFVDSIGNDVVGPNFDASWTHDLSSISGETIVGATISFGIWGHEPQMTGDQVALFTIEGVDFTASLNTLFEASVDGTTGQTTYNVYSINLDGFPAILAALQGDYSGAFQLQLQGSSDFPTSGDEFNSAQLTGASLIITTADAAAAVPEPSSVLLLAGVGGLFGLARRRRNRRREPQTETLET